MSITTQILLTFLATQTPTSGVVRDLCDIVNQDTGTPILCEPHPEGAPRYDSTVCCDSGACFDAPRGYCLDDEELFYCELGEELTSGEVSCYFEIPNYCDEHACEPGFQAQPQAASMCCNAGICWTIYGPNDCEVQDMYWCQDGMTNTDGTVTCLDD